MSTTGWITRWWIVGPLLPRLLRERDALLYVSMEYIENIASRFILFPYRHQQWRTDEDQVRPGNLIDEEEWEADYHDLKRSSTNTYGTAMCGVPVKFKQLRNFSFNILPKSMKGWGRGNEGGSDDDKRYQQHPQRRRLPIVHSHLLGQVFATAETQ
jgi:hypothetical protein